MTVSIASVVQVDISVATRGGSSINFNLSNILGNSEVLGASNPIQEYSSLTAVGGHFATTTPEYRTAAIYFSQSPRPRSILISRRFTTGASGGIYFPNASLADLQTLTGFTGTAPEITFRVTEGATTSLQQYTLADTVDLSGVASLAAASAALNTALAAATFTGGGTGRITSFYDTSTESIGFSLATVAGGSTAVVGEETAASYVESARTNTSTVKFDDIFASATAVRFLGADANETTEEALNRIVRLRNDWYCLLTTINDDGVTANRTHVEDAAAWTEAQGGSSNPHIFFASTSDRSVVLSAVTADLGSELTSRSYKKTAIFYDPDDLYIAAAAAATMAAINWEGLNTAITLAYKPAAGVSVNNLIADSDITTLLAKNVNALVQYGTLFSGYNRNVQTTSGDFVDAIWGIDVITVTMQDSVASYLSKQGKVPFTDGGAARIAAIITETLNTFVGNGLLGPGTWRGEPFGPLERGERVDGFFLYTPPESTATQTQRDNRTYPPFQMALIGAGAIESVQVIGTLQN